MKRYLDVSKGERKRIKSCEHRRVMLEDIGKTNSWPFNDFFGLQSFLMGVEQSLPSVQVRLFGLKAEGLIDALRIGNNLGFIGDKLSVISEVGLRLPVLMIGGRVLKHVSLGHFGHSPLG